MMIENIELLDGGEFDHSGKVLHLENDHEYYFLVRAVDALGNKDDNEVWLIGIPDGVPDPLNPELLSSVYIQGSTENIWVNDSTVYISDSTRISMYGCTDPTSPLYTGWYGALECLGMQYHETQGYLYCAMDDDYNYAMVTLAHPPEPGGKMIKIVDSFINQWSRDVCVEGDTCYIMGNGTFQSPYIYVINIENPEKPVMLGSVNLGPGNGRKIIHRNGFVFCSTTGGMKVVDATSPTSPEIVYDGYNDDIRDICLWGDYALVANEDAGDLVVYDITNPVLPQYKGSMVVPSIYMTSLAVRDDQYVYLAVKQPDRIMVIDWSDLGNIHEAADITCNSPEDIFYDGKFLYIADGSQGLKIFF